MNIINKTALRYGFLWRKEQNIQPLTRWHFNGMQEEVCVSIVQGKRGIDIGSGCGYDTYIMARNNPGVHIASLDISDGIFKAKEVSRELANVWFIKGSVLILPIKDNVFDFAYSFGVLHHIPEPEHGLKEIARILKADAPIFLYLYEDHSENIIKYVVVKIIRRLRKITVRIPPRLLYLFCVLSSPFVFMIFSLPAKILMKFYTTKNIIRTIPFNFGRNPFSLIGDLYDRFSAPIEHRFSSQEVYGMLIKSGFYNIHITRLKTSAGWVAWGYKK